MQISTAHQLMAALREGKYTSLGSYPIFFLTSDGEALSFDAVRENLWQIARAVRDHDNGGWRVVAYDVNWEDESLYCAHTGDQIECAYPSS